MNLRKFARSFQFAFLGLLHVVRTEQNMRVHLLAACTVLFAAAFFQVSSFEWIALILCIALVLAAECLNSSIERLADRVSPDEHFLIKHAKDAAAAAVLSLSFGAAAIGLIVFLPKVRDLLFPS